MEPPERLNLQRGSKMIMQLTAHLMLAVHAIAGHGFRFADETVRMFLSGAAF